MSRVLKFRVWDKVAKQIHICGTNTHDTFFFDPDTCDFTYYNLQNLENPAVTREKPRGSPVMAR